ATAGGLLKIQIGGQDADVTVKQTTPANLTSGLHGWDGAAWRKLPLLFGYSDTLALEASNLALAAGTNTLDASACPAGYIWVVTSILIMYVGTVPAGIFTDLISGANTLALYRQFSPVSGAGYDRQGFWVLKAGDYLRCVVTGATLNDDLYLHASGYAQAVT
ncbi:MAG: hypothetical protein Q8N51_09045, partial [Gammaproteobacteria bacterium]|nr:hypothetical protein [Gammaproteobacteria bacterium]